MIYIIIPILILLTTLSIVILNILEGNISRAQPVHISTDHAEEVLENLQQLNQD